MPSSVSKTKNAPPKSVELFATIPVGHPGCRDWQQQWDSHHRGLLDALRVVESRSAAVIVGDPKWLAGEKGNSPRIGQLRIRMVSHPGLISHQVGLLVTRLLTPQRLCHAHHNGPE